MLVDDVLDLDRGDVLAAGDDDVLGAVLELDIAVRVHDAEIAGMEPAAGEGFLRRLLVLEIALHDDIAAEHDLAERPAVGGRLLHRGGVHHRQIFERVIAHALADAFGQSFLVRKLVPGGVPFIQRRGAVSLGQPVEVGQLETRFVHLGEHGGGRGRGGVVESDAMAEVAPLLGRRVEERRHDERRAGKMGHAVIGDGVVYRLRPHRAEAHMRAGDEAQRPGEAPAVAVEHRQRPQIYGMLAHAGRDGVGVAHQRRAAMVIDHAFGIAGRAARVVQRDRVPFVRGHGPGKLRVTVGDEGLVVEIAEAFALDATLQVAIVDEERRHVCLAERLFQNGRELRVADQDFGLGVVEHEGDGGRIEACVDGMEHGADHGHAVMSLEHRRRVGEHDRDGVAGADAARRKGGGKLARPRVETAVIDAVAAVNDRGVLGMDGRRPLEKDERRQRLVVRRVFIEASVVGIGHGLGGRVSSTHPSQGGRP